VLDREAVEALRGISLEEVDDLTVGERVPVLVVEELDGRPSKASAAGAGR
jgi:hypothetical protein